VGTAVVLVLLVLAIAIPNYVSMQNKSKRAEVPANVNGIKTAEMAYDAAFDQFIEVPVYHPSEYTMGEALRPWTAGSRFDTLGWSPDGQVRGSYKVNTITGSSAWGYDFEVIGISDVDGDGRRATYTASKSTNANQVTSLSTY